MALRQLFRKVVIRSHTDWEHPFGVSFQKIIFSLLLVLDNLLKLFHFDPHDNLVDFLVLRLLCFLAHKKGLVHIIRCFGVEVTTEMRQNSLLDHEGLFKFVLVLPQCFQEGLQVVAKHLVVQCRRI